jgi:hypothetical protein
MLRATEGIWLWKEAEHLEWEAGVQFISETPTVLSYEITAQASPGSDGSQTGDQVRELWKGGKQSREDEDLQLRSWLIPELQCAGDTPARSGIKQQ